jgi:NAD(P)-dependent dehydrogenase (short-subunit alcohol dehydrogenase family)
MSSTPSSPSSAPTALGRFDGKVVLVTGAASGIGAATVERIAREGGTLLCTDVQAEAVRESAKRAIELGASAEAVVSDVSDPDQVKSSVAACIDHFGRIDVLCNIAGILRFDITHEMPLATWNQILNVNLTGTFLMCQAALPHLLETRGNIVNTSSTSALKGLPYGAAYGASKAGVLALTAAIATEYGRKGVRANAVCPGSITTPMTRQPEFPEGANMRLVMRHSPLDEFRGPETVASLIAFLASDDAVHINGEHVRVDGASLS